MAYSNTVQSIAQSLNVKISESIDLDDVAKDAEQFINIIVDLANRLKKHKISKTLTVKDINDALGAKNCQPLYGYRPSKDIKIKSVGVIDKNTELLTDVDPQIPLSNVVNSPLKKYPIETHFDFHWLAINGVQPQIEENLCESKSTSSISRTIGPIPEQTKLSDQPVTMINSKLMVSFQLQQLYFKALETIKKQSNSTSSTYYPDFMQLIQTFSKDAAIQPLLPFFLRTIWDTISYHSRNINQLQIALCLTEALFSNQNLDREPYLQNFTSVAMTLSMSPSLGDDTNDGVVSLRQSAADFLGIIKKFSQNYPALQKKVAEHLTSIIFDARVSSSSQFGAALALQCIDPTVVRVFLIPNIHIVFNKIKLEIAHPDPYFRSEAMNLYGALLRLCAICYHHDTANNVSPEEISRIYSKPALLFGSDLYAFESKE